MKKIVYGCLITLTMAACGPSPLESIRSGSTQPDKVPDERLYPSTLGAKWLSNCEPEGNSLRVQLTVMERRLLSKSIQYGDANCKVPFAETTFVMNVAPKVVDVDRYRFDGNAQNLIGAVLTPKSDDAVQFYNSRKHCGYKDWAVGVGKDVLGTNCVATDMKRFAIVTHVKGEQLSTYECIVDSRDRKFCEDHTYTKVHDQPVAGE